ncbi:MAG: sulfur carrier protein ThiS [Jatrophihabitans sp.]|uniref:sulfur carrier protein ThiS n=1 Tax=Jatrophihabitans sp. TaxID=1932789 RepID=UPI003F80A38C
MRITLNGEPHELADDLTIDAFLIARAGTTRGSAVVVDGEVVPRSRWAEQRLADGQTVELITAVQGG